MKKNNSPVALITGVTGQDGAHIADLLLKKGYEVYGTYRRGTNKTWRTDLLGITRKIRLIEFQLNEPQSITALLQEINPDEIYHLAAESFVADSFKYPNVILESNTHATCNILEAARMVSPTARIFFASSSEIFGQSKGNTPLNEFSAPQPRNPYAISKLAADYFVKMYRERHGIFVCSGILFNHEGPLRSSQFVSRKITHNIVRLKQEGGDPIKLGNLNSARDWGSAADYVHAMKSMLAVDEPKDFVIASGKLFTVRDLLRLAALSAGFDPVFEGKDKDEVCIDKTTGLTIAEVSSDYFRPHDTLALVGDSSKIEAETGWRRTKSFEQVVDEMVAVDFQRYKMGVTNI